jgi:hypothetical protein
MALGVCKYFINQQLAPSVHWKAKYYEIFCNTKLAFSSDQRSMTIFWLNIFYSSMNKQKLIPGKKKLIPAEIIYQS